MMAEPVAALIGRADWTGEVARRLKQAGYATARYDDRAGYVTRLADDHAALVVVDGDAEGWQFWAVTPKASPATRRVPVVVVASGAAVRRGALQSGADAALAPDELLTKLPDLLANLARVPDPATADRLSDQCAGPLPPLAREGIENFNAGQYYLQHELLEELWLLEAGPVRDLYQGILQVGVAYYQITRGNHRGALKMLLRSIQWLAALPDVCQGVDVKQLREDAARVRAALESMPPVDIASFDRNLLRPVHLSEGSSALREE